MANKLPNLSDLKDCPQCGSNEYIILSTVVGGTSTTRYSFDGREVINSIDEMYGCIKMKEQSFIFCSDCHAKIARNNKK